jgi:tetratricopeptide (TPR) repeat protein
VPVVHRSRRVALAVVACWIGWGSIAHADLASCQKKPTRACLLEEALRSDSAPLAGKERLDVLLEGEAINHLDSVTPADIEEAERQAKSNRSVTAYFYLAVRALVAAHREKQAFDLVMSLGDVMRQAGFSVLTRDLVKAGEVDQVFVYGRQVTPPLDPKGVFVTLVQTLAEMGKIEEALAVIVTLPGSISELNMTDMLTAVGQAYVKRGDTRTAQGFFDKAKATLEAGLGQPNAVGSTATQLRFALISVQALRGDTEGVKTALQQLPKPADAKAEPLAEIYRTQGYQRVVYALVQAKQYQPALDLAKSMPVSDKDRGFTFANVARMNASNGRINDARAALSLMGDKTDPKLRASIAVSIAVALVKAGDPASAVETAAQVSDPTSRKAALFAVAQELPQ